MTRMLKFMKISTLLLIGLLISTQAHSLSVRHDITPVFNYTQIRTSDRTQYQFYSPGINYYALLAEDYGVFVSSTLFTPIQGVQTSYDFTANKYGEGSKTNLWDYYNVPIGFDVLVGLGTNFPSKFKLKTPYNDHMEFGAGIGIHLNGIFLRNSDYDNRYYNSLTLGLGIDLRAVFQPGKNFYLGLMFNGNFDFFDLLHTTNEMASFINLNTGIVFGFKTGKGGES
jgi:hypothetical protein